MLRKKWRVSLQRGIVRFTVKVAEMTREQLEAEVIHLRRQRRAHKRSLAAQQEALTIRNERIRVLEQAHLTIEKPLSRELQDITTSWRVGRWFVMILIIIVLGWTVSFWANSCAYRNAEKSSIPAAVVGQFWIGV